MATAYVTEVTLTTGRKTRIVTTDPITEPDPHLGVAKVLGDSIEAEEVQPSGALPFPPRHRREKE